MQKESIQLPPGQSFRLIRWTRSIRAVENLLAGGAIVPMQGEGSRWHYHPEMELTLFSKGRGERFVGDHIGSFEAGDMVLLGGQLPHYWHAKGDTCGISLQWFFPPHHPFWQLPETDGMQPLLEAASAGLQICGPVRDQLFAILETMTNGSNLRRLAGFLEILAVLGSEFGARVRSKPESKPGTWEGISGNLRALAGKSFIPPGDSTYQDSMSRVLRHLTLHYRSPQRLDQILRIARLSRPTFSRQFKRHTGRSLSGFLLQLRLQSACRELAATRQSILQVGLGCGFTQVSFFNRVFRRAMGCSPGEYRKAVMAGSGP